MAQTEPTDLTRPLYSYCPEYLHTWLDEIKAETNLTKSDVVNLFLEIGMKNFTSDDISRIHQSFILFGDKGLDLAHLTK